MLLAGVAHVGPFVIFGHCTRRRGLVKSRYRLLVDVSSHGAGEARQQLQGSC